MRWPARSSGTPPKVRRVSTGHASKSSVVPRLAAPLLSDSLPTHQYACAIVKLTVSQRGCDKMRWRNSRICRKFGLKRGESGDDIMRDERAPTPGESHMSDTLGQTAMRPSVDYTSCTYDEAS